MEYFSIGDIVVTTAEELRDYSDCDDGRYGKVVIPPGSVGIVIGYGLGLHGAWTYLVKFEDVDNYPTLYYDGSIIGEGHYIDLMKLKKLDVHVDSNFEPATYDDFKELF